VTNAPVEGTDFRRIDNDRIVMLRGDVVLTTDTAIIHADEVDFHLGTNEAELRAMFGSSSFGSIDQAVVGTL
jgi:lipopolysaccharide export system protein LptA